MPDLTRQIFYHCETAENFKTEVQGSSGKYTVRYSYSRKGSVQYDYSCTCWAYRKGGGKHCKHIKQVKESGEHCNWMQFTDGGEPVVKDGETFCPRCGKKANSMPWGV